MTSSNPASFNASIAPDVTVKARNPPPEHATDTTGVYGHCKKDYNNCLYYIVFTTPIDDFCVKLSIMLPYI